MRHGIEILEELEQGKLAKPFDTIIPRTLGLHLVGQGRFNDALERFPKKQNIDWSITDNFNVGIATWGVTGECPAEFFVNALAKHEESEDLRSDANYLQCIALCYGVVGKYSAGIEMLDRCREELLKKPRSTFSCWRYRDLELPLFLDDLEEMKQQFQQERCEPLLLRKKTND